MRYGNGIFSLQRILDVHGVDATNLIKSVTHRKRGSWSGTWHRSCFTLRTTKMAFHLIHNTTATAPIFSRLSRIIHLVGVPRSIGQQLSLLNWCWYLVRGFFLQCLLHRPCGSPWQGQVPPMSVREICENHLRMCKNIAKWRPHRIFKESVAITLSTNCDLAIGCLGVCVATIVVKMMKRKFASSRFSNFGSARNASSNGLCRTLSFVGIKELTSVHLDDRHHCTPA